MRFISIWSLTSKLGLVAMLGCGIDEQWILDQRLANLDSGIEAQELIASQNLSGLDASTWSDPVWLGPVINSTFRDWRPRLSTNGLRLYFHSNRPDGGHGGYDLWMSRRTGPNCPWEEPVNMGPTFNTTNDDGDAEPTPDGHMIFFAGNGHGGFGGGDILVSEQTNHDDDLAWGQPVNLGPDVNTDANEGSPAYVLTENGGTLYFNREHPGSSSTFQIYKVLIDHKGRTRGPAVLVSELSTQAPISNNAPFVRSDGREMLFWSGGADAPRPGSIGLADVWVSTRKNVQEKWSEPRNLGMPVNSQFAELSATLSHDGRTLFLTMARDRGGLGLQDMWMSTRGPEVRPTEEGSNECPPALVEFTWSEPVNLGPPVNTSAIEIMPTLSRDGLSLYFVSDRQAGGFGNTDIWVARRATVDSPWETPVNLGATINSSGPDVAPELSIDGRLLFFSSNRQAGHGRLDIYVSHRSNPNDDFGWGSPVNLGPHVNTTAGDRGADHVVVSSNAPAVLYFGRGIGLEQSDIYSAPITHYGEPLAEAEIVGQLNAPGAVNDAPSLRQDGREIFFMSDRAGFGFDIWVSTRTSPHEAWSTPSNVGAPVNTPFAEERPDLSFDGRTLLFDSDRPHADGLVDQDIWMSTRIPSGN